MQRFGPERSSTFVQYWSVLWLTAGIALLGVGLEALAGYRSVGFLFLVHVMIAGLLFPLGPVLFAACLSALAWNFLFIPPRFNLAISDSEDLMMLLAYVIAAGVIGTLARRLKHMQVQAAARDRHSRFLVRFAEILAADQDCPSVALKALQFIESRFDLRAGLKLGDADGLLSPTHFLTGAAEEALMTKARAASQARGWDVNNPRHLAIPLASAVPPFNALLLRRQPGSQLDEESQALLLALSEPLGYFLQRESLRSQSHEAARLRESEALHQALLDSVSHELRTPLTSLLGSTAALEGAAHASDGRLSQELLDEIRAAGERLNRVIENLLDMTRLNSGALALRKEWHDPAELTRLTVNGLQRPLAGHRVLLSLPAEPPLVSIDYRLMEHALSNLLLNAAAYAPLGTEISVTVEALEERLQWRVADRGPGIPPEDLDRVFGKFFRMPGSPTGGTGLGLYITRSLLQAHAGDASARLREGGGSEFILNVPLGPSPLGPAEAAA